MLSQIKVLYNYNNGSNRANCLYNFMKLIKLYNSIKIGDNNKWNNSVVNGINKTNYINIWIRTKMN